MKQKVVVTGASSFVGMHLTSTFVDKGYEVAITHSKPLSAYEGVQAQRLKHLAGMNVKTFQMDLRDTVQMSSVLEKFPPNLWIHHAGHAARYASPDYDFKTSLDVNVTPLKTLYPFLAKTGCSVIVTSSSMEYSSTDSACLETDACLPDTLYGLSKLMETLTARQMALQYGVPTRVARLFIPFGFLDSPAKLIPAVIEKISRGQSMDLSPCEQRRDFIAVTDVCDGYLRLAEDMSRTLFDLFNLCSGQPIRLKDLLIRLIQTMGADPALLRFGAIPMRAGEPEVSYGSNQKAVTLLNWNCRNPLDSIAAYASKPAPVSAIL